MVDSECNHWTAEVLMAANLPSLYCTTSSVLSAITPPWASW